MAGCLLLAQATETHPELWTVMDSRTLVGGRAFFASSGDSAPKPERSWLGGRLGRRDPEKPGWHSGDPKSRVLHPESRTPNSEIPNMGFADSKTQIPKLGWGGGGIADGDSPDPVSVSSRESQRRQQCLVRHSPRGCSDAEAVGTSPPLPMNPVKLSMARTSGTQRQAASGTVLGGPGLVLEVQSYLLVEEPLDLGGDNPCRTANPENA